MSRLGKMPIPLPKGIEVKVENKQVQVRGPKGTLTYPLSEAIALKSEGGLLYVAVKEGMQLPGRMYGLYRALINTMVEGVSKGWTKRLILIGVGYRAAVQGHVLDLQLGFSHPTQLKIPPNVNVAIDKSTLIVISGIDKQAVGQFAAAVRAIKPPEPYKGKGIRYEGEVVRKKDGKAAKGKTAA